MIDDSGMILGEAYENFISQLRKEHSQEYYQNLNRFVQWCGKDNSVNKLTPQIVADYAVWIGKRGQNTLEKLEPVKSFLRFLDTKGLVTTKLASHVRSPKNGKGIRDHRYLTPVTQAHLTKEGYNELQARMDMLKSERVNIIADIKTAMADKDFRENAPLDAAKERQGFIESQIRDLENTLSTAIITSKVSSIASLEVTLGNTVTLKDVSSGRRVSYTLVHSSEADPTNGKISDISPVGKALLKKQAGKEVSVVVPQGTLKYIIESIGN